MGVIFLESIKEWFIAIPIFILFIVGYVAFVEFAQYALAIALIAWIPICLGSYLYKSWKKQGS